MLEAGLKGMIGKGSRSREVKDAMVRHGAVYFAANMLETREQAYNERVPRVQEALGRADIDDMVQRKFEFDAQLDEIEIKPRKSDLSIEAFTLVWLPWRLDSNGVAASAY